MRICIHTFICLAFLSDENSYARTRARSDGHKYARRHCTDRYIVRVYTCCTCLLLPTVRFFSPPPTRACTYPVEMIFIFSVAFSSGLYVTRDRDTVRVSRRRGVRNVYTGPRRYRLTTRPKQIKYNVCVRACLRDILLQCVTSVNALLYRYFILYAAAVIL